ncbi:response regulator transcription factor [Amycolatopsis sp. OK19-0408]|uniref:Response regulator transcription factor n=1 Tax=Amycolatopsis iheyensis TaxID=2945988 RepID=A0A9X2SPX8_9PSEU|nr:response regulator transcription factor [Amycolatopsis iheyensis]MCR6490464.1 response regulator transcription factor [Amycolatopsis iheyensis]
MGEPQTIKVIVVDDQQVVREGLVALMSLLDDVEVVGSAANGAQALELVASLERLDVVLMDLNMPVLSGVEATKRITQDHPEVAVVVLTTYSDDESIAGALAAGARGYLTKEAGRGEIGSALRAVVAGQLTFGADVSRQVVSALFDSGGPSAAKAAPHKEGLPDGLTAREAEVLGLIAAGLSNGKIAAELFIGEATVKTHINNAFAKIGVRNRVEAVRYAVRHGLEREPKSR